jgi:LDH2 family malate/lactate/ureidoglycolate dehydrogenase
MERAMPPLVAAQELAALIRACCAGVGLADDDAQAVAEVLVDANLRGIDSHGVARLPLYMRRVHAGLARGTEASRVVAHDGPLCRMDAAQALGPAVATKAVDHAVHLARDHGIGLVAVGDSTHFGHAGFYARRAACRQLIALVTTNGPANMAPHGGAERFHGTNPLALGIPLGRRGEFVLDMSASVVARGKIIRSHALERPIEPGWAIDSAGAPTIDPAAALAGAVLPLGGAKGSGLALGASLLTAVLAGAAFDHEVAPMHGCDRPQRIGHLFVVIDPWRLAPAHETLTRLEELVDRLHQVRPAGGFDRVLYAGERGELLARQRRRDGIPLEPAEVAALAETCDELGLAGVAAWALALLAPAAEVAS